MDSSLDNSDLLLMLELVALALLLGFGAWRLYQLQRKTSTDRDAYDHGPSNPARQVDGKIGRDDVAIPRVYDMRRDGQRLGGREIWHPETH